MSSKLSECQEKFNIFKQSLLNDKLWAEKRENYRFIATYFSLIFSKIVLVYDTWGKISAGILHGETKSFGLFTECVRFSNWSDVKTQHCLISCKSINSSKKNFDWERFGTFKCN